ncbi:MAG TPA: hypothetical protein DDW27_05425 [Bacteroidales bacterium]|nr:hypothetical protein [Bacteroidales bacterium]
MSENKSSIPRRKLLKDAALAGVGSAMIPLAGFTGTVSQRKKKGGLIEAENSKPGNPDWQIQYVRFDDPITLASYPLIRCLRSSVIEGYVSRTSLLPGESIDFKVSMNPPGKFIIDIYRLGYYGGTGGRHMARLGSFTGNTQAIPMMTLERLRECNWDTATTFTIPDDWPSGVYLGKLSRDEKFGKQSYVIFVVKEHRKSDILCQVSDLTWQSYNKWPGNDSLYDDGTPEVWYTGPNVRVSFDRPYAKYCQYIDAPRSAGSGEYLLWEHPLTYWLEQQGYDVTYCSNLDLHFDPEILSLSKVFISVGHDEYWTRKMYEEAVKARDNGLSFAFLCGNSVWCEINLFDSFIGVPGRVFSRDKWFPDEEKLMGNSSYGVGYGDWVVRNSRNWIYEGTGMKDGDIIPAIIGWEFHGPPLPDITGLEIVAESQLSNSKFHMAVVYPCSKGNWVFNAGTIWWTEGLSQPPGHIPAGSPGGLTFGVNPHVQKITSNILDKMIRDSPI